MYYPDETLQAWLSIFQVFTADNSRSVITYSFSSILVQRKSCCGFGSILFPTNPSNISNSMLFSQNSTFSFCFAFLVQNLFLGLRVASVKNSKKSQLSNYIKSQKKKNTTIVFDMITPNTPILITYFPLFCSLFPLSLSSISTFFSPSPATKPISPAQLIMNPF